MTSKKGKKYCSVFGCLNNDFANPDLSFFILPTQPEMDVSTGLQTIRQLLLGRKFVFHHRFLPVIAPRSIPPPDVPRGPEYKYSDQWYGNRDLLNSVKPPVVAPVLSKGFKSGGKPNPCYPNKPSIGPSVKFPSELPTPGCVWWFDAHCYYKEEFQTPCGLPSKVPCAPPPSPCPCPPPENERPVVRVDPCANKTPPCKLEPCKVEKVLPPRPPEICEPCRNEDPKKKS